MPPSSLGKYMLWDSFWGILGVLLPIQYIWNVMCMYYMYFWNFISVMNILGGEKHLCGIIKSSPQPSMNPSWCICMCLFTIFQGCVERQLHPKHVALAKSPIHVCTCKYLAGGCANFTAPEDLMAGLLVKVWGSEHGHSTHNGLYNHGHIRFLMSHTSICSHTVQLWAWTVS